jgi:hypothetical protein
MVKKKRRKGFRLCGRCGQENRSHSRYCSKCRRVFPELRGK